jgi:hypothetical protein
MKVTCSPPKMTPSTHATHVHGFGTMQACKSVCLATAWCHGVANATAGSTRPRRGGRASARHVNVGLRLKVGPHKTLTFDLSHVESDPHHENMYPGVLAHAESESGVRCGRNLSPGADDADQSAHPWLAHMGMGSKCSKYVHKGNKICRSRICGRWKLKPKP